MEKKNNNASIYVLIISGFVAFLPAFLYGYNIVLNFCYENGCPLEDQGLCAYLMWHNQLLVRSPPSLATFLGDNFFANHFCPIFSLLSALSKTVDLSMFDFFALIQGISSGLFAFSMFYIIYKMFELTRTREIMLALLLSVLISFSGISVTSMLYPHYEMLFIPCSVLFFAFLVLQRPLAALPFFILALSIREDTGFHLLSILFFLMMIDLLQKRRVYRPYIYYALIAVAYSIAALLVQKYLRHGALCCFTDLYLGSPPFSHLSWSLIKERAVFIFQNRGYFYAPLLVMIMWSIWTRKLFILFGILALLPWFLFNFLAVTTWASGLYFYYGIFYLLILAWPVLAYKAYYKEQLTHKLKKQFLGWYSIVILASVIFNNPFSLDHFVLQPGVSQKLMVQRFQTALVYNFDQLGDVLVDGRAASLAPGIFTKNQLTYLRTLPTEERKRFHPYADPKYQELGAFDTVIFYSYNGVDEYIPFYALLSHLPNLYRVIGTNIFVASNRTLNDLSAFSPVLVQILNNQENVLWQEHLLKAFSNPFFQTNVIHKELSYEISEALPSGVIVYSNSIRLPKGQYCIHFSLSASQPVDVHKPILTVDVVSQNEAHSFMKKELFYSDLDSKNGRMVCFNVDENLPNALITIRFWNHQNAKLVIKDLKLKNSMTP